jgi:hypothetical protein
VRSFAHDEDVCLGLIVLVEMLKTLILGDGWLCDEMNGMNGSMILFDIVHVCLSRFSIVFFIIIYSLLISISSFPWIPYQMKMNLKPTL